MVILLYSLACVLFLLGMGSDVFFRLHRLSLALTIVAVLLMLMAHRLRKRQFEGTVVDSLVQRQKQFQRLPLGLWVVTSYCVGNCHNSTLFLPWRPRS